MISGGRKAVRSALFLASLPPAVKTSLLNAFRQRLLDAGKPKMVAAIAAACKLLNYPQTPSCETNTHGAHKPLDHQHSR